MKYRHRHQRDVVFGPFIPVGPLGAAGPHQVQEVRMRQHRALGLAGGAGGIKLDRDILGRDRYLRIVAALRVAPARKILPAHRAALGRDESTHAWQLCLDAADLFDELRPDEQHRRLAILDDEGDLGTGQPPVDRRHHHIGLHRAQQQLEIDVAVLAEIGDALMRLDAERLQSMGDLIGMRVEVGIAGPASLEFERHGVAAGLALRADNVGQMGSLVDLRHVSPVSIIVVNCEERKRRSHPAFFRQSWMASRSLSLGGALRRPVGSQ